MIRVTVTHHATKISSRAMQRLTAPPTVNSAILETEPDYSILGEPTVDWLPLSDTTRQRQFCKRDHTARLDHLFIVDVEELHMD